MSTTTAKASELPQYLKSLRESRAITLREVESKTGISNSYLSQIESGKITRPSPQTLHKLSILYEASYDDLLALAGYPTPHLHSRRSDVARSSYSFGDLNREEERALLEYLTFLRSRPGKGRRRT